MLYAASGSSARIFSTFSLAPSQNTIGMGLVAADWRSAMAISRPCEGSRDRSITKASGGDSRQLRRRAGPKLLFIFDLVPSVL